MAPSRVRSLSGPAESNQPAAMSSNRSRPSSGQPMRSMIALIGRSWASSVTASKVPFAMSCTARASARWSMVAASGRSALGDSRSVKSLRCSVCVGGSWQISALLHAVLNPSLRPIPGSEEKVFQSPSAARTWS
jgi:hypothetical protein